MSKLRVVAFLATGLVVLPASLGHAADIALNIASGLWEITATPKMTGALPDNLTADQRAKMEAAMGKAMQPRVYRECLTPAKLESAFQAGEALPARRPSLRIRRPTLQTSDQCTDAKGTRELDVHMQAPTPQTLVGAVNMVATRSGKSLTIHNDLQGKWVAADCGGVDGPQPVTLNRSRRGRWRQGRSCSARHRRRSSSPSPANLSPVVPHSRIRSARKWRKPWRISHQAVRTTTSM